MSKYTDLAMERRSQFSPEGRPAWNCCQAVMTVFAQLQNRFHVSAAEIDEQDTHQIIVIGVAAIVPHNAMADSLMNEISQFVEDNCEAEILEEQREIR